MNLSKKEREQLRMMFGGKCAYCGCELGPRWCADHIEPVYRKIKKVKTPDGPYTYKLVSTGETYHPERDTKDNLFPCCSPCNVHKGANTLDGWRIELERITGILQRGYPTYRHAIRFGQVIERPSPIVFYFEKYNSEQEKAS